MPEHVILNNAPRRFLLHTSAARRRSARAAHEHERVPRHLLADGVDEHGLVLAQRVLLPLEPREHLRLVDALDVGARVAALLLGLRDVLGLREARPALGGPRAPLPRVLALAQPVRNVALVELDAGLRGDLSISEPMEMLMNSLYDDKVPKSWNSFAWQARREALTLGPGV